jgi:transcriptional regulator PpsR
MDPKPTERTNELSEFAPELASTVVRVAGDIALVIGDDGVIRTVAEGNVPLRGPEAEWVGRPWAETVGGASARQKVELLLQEAQRHGVSQRRELSHPVGGGGEIPVSWAAVRLGERGPVLAVGRDLRAVSAIQQRFLDAQQELEREYWQRRQAEARYRQLFQVANDAVLVLDAADFTLIEANPAATQLLRLGAAQVGSSLQAAVEPGSRPALDELLLTARTTGRAAEMRLRLLGPATGPATASGGTIDLSATPFRADERLCLLLRARRTEAGSPLDHEPQAVLDFISQTPDAVVVTDTAARVLWANPAFVELCQAPSELRLRGCTLADALGGDAMQWGTLLARVRSRGIVGQATVTLRPAGAPALLASVSAALLAEGDQEHIGFTLRLDAATALHLGSTDELSHHIGQLTGHLGSLTLEQLLSEASRMAEVHFIQAALCSAEGRLDGAAAMLRVSSAQLAARMQQLQLPQPPLAGQATPEWPS